MNRTAQRKLKAQNPDADRAELRQLRRGRQESVFSGAGHGKRSYQKTLTLAEKREQVKAEKTLDRTMGSIFQKIFDAVTR